MKKFTTTADMVEAYTVNHNSRCDHTDKHFTTEEVTKLRLTTITRQAMRMNYGTVLNTKQAYIIHGFGYVEI